MKRYLIVTQQIAARPLAFFNLFWSILLVAQLAPAGLMEVPKPQKRNYRSSQAA